MKIGTGILQGAVIALAGASSASAGIIHRRGLFLGRKRQSLRRGNLDLRSAKAAFGRGHLTLTQGRETTHLVIASQGPFRSREGANRSSVCSEQYRAKGIECIRRATRLADCEYKEVYFNLAIQWMAFAAEAEDYPHRQYGAEAGPVLSIAPDAVGREQPES